ncbi:MAG: sulfotransferase domain-containing protein [Candidatus Omnitrophica bacterium]|nr:sulfotransferase domain-containing protein [Candidatus Omnitrophota bacterium]
MKKIIKKILRMLPPKASQYILIEIVPWVKRVLKVYYRARKSVLLKKAAVQPNSVSANLRLGRLCFELSQWEESAQYYERVVCLEPKLFEAHIRLELLYRLVGQKDKHERDKFGNILFNDRTYKLDKDSLAKVVYCCRRMVQLFPESIEAHVKLGNALVMAEGVSQEAVGSFHVATKIKLKHARGQGKSGLIFVASLPRSGSGNMERYLRSVLDIKNDNAQAIAITNWGFPNYVISPPGYAVSNAPIPDGINVNHVNASKANLMVLNLVIDRMIVNVRDPRQALLSWVHFMNYFRYVNDVWGVLEGGVLPENYFLMSLQEQISWQIENFYLPVTVKWIEGWLNADENPEFYPKILFTNLENVVTNPEAHYKAMFDFYKLDGSKFKSPSQPEFKENSHMRKGRIDEWREVFTAEQIKISSEMIPERLIKKFGWPRS